MLEATKDQIAQWLKDELASAKADGFVLGLSGGLDSSVCAALLKKNTKIKDISPAGSLRRWKETIGDIDILTTGKDGAKIIKIFTRFP
ncbi:unnamed protein product, partial [marine sediment metagenome]